MNQDSKSPSLISLATRHFLSEAWKYQKNAPWDFIHSCFYARWPYLYISIGSGNHPIVERLRPLLQVWEWARQNKKPMEKVRPSLTQSTGTAADIYHGKAIPLKQAQELVMVNESVNLPDLEQVIPYVRARALIQQNPDHILLVKCPCRMARKNPCLPLDVCMVIGEPFAELVHQHYSSLSRWITQKEACAILEREDARGRVHHAFFSEMMLGRFFGICNCCSCCCSAIKSHNRGTPMLSPSGYVAQIDEKKCTTCEICQSYCQFGALRLKNELNWVDEELCMGCGICVGKCAEGAISLRLEPGKGIPLEITELVKPIHEAHISQA